MSVHSQLRRTITVTVKNKLPEWVAAGDVVVNRNGRWFLRSLTQTEPRWRKLWRWICRQF